MVSKRNLSQQSAGLTRSSGYTTADIGSVPLPGYAYHDDHLRWSQGNPFKDGAYRGSGSFYVRKEHSGAQKAPEIFWTRNGNFWRGTPYVGWLNSSPIVPNEASHAQAQTDHFVENMGFGATGWARARPGNPLANATIFGGELRRLPQVPQAFLPLLLYRRLARFRQLGNEYLNVVFGWVPFVAEVRKLMHLHHRLDKHLSQIVRNNGRGIRRSRVIRDDHASSISEENFTYPWQGWNNIPPNWSHGIASKTTQTITSDRIWFMAQFRYYIRDIGSSQWTRQATRALYGGNITPDALYNLLPWSWMIDWFSNMGDVISNMSSNAVENLTADYAHVMRTIKVQTTVTASTKWVEKHSFRGYIPPGQASASATNEVVIKVRSKASPYGFGVNFGGLSAYQMGVVAALGISRW